MVGKKTCEEKVVKKGKGYEWGKMRQGESS